MKEKHKKQQPGRNGVNSLDKTAVRQATRGAVAEYSDLWGQSLFKNNEQDLERKTLLFET